MPTTSLTTIPAWTAEDFYGDTVYEWLYNHQDNKFLFQRFLAQAQVLAKSLKVVGFSRMWNAYLEAQNPRKDAVYISDTQFPDQPVQLNAGKYLCDDRGVSYVGSFGEVVKVCSHPIMPVRRLVNVDTGEVKMEITYRRGINGKWQTLVAGRDVLGSAQKIIALSRNDIGVNSENAKEMVKYMSEMDDLNYDVLETQKATSHMGWLPDGQFAPFAREIVYDGESPEFVKIYRGLCENGSEQVWTDTVKAVRNGNSIPARIALAASFAAPLVQPMGALPFFVHLWGTQGCGKTVGLLLAASVWGRPEVGGYIKSFSGTKVSFETYSAFCCNIPILLDELQVMADRKSFDDIIYSLCEGASKGRGAKDGGMQLQRHWSTCIISTGEMPIVQNNSGGGAAVRTIEVNYGGQPLFEDARGVANTLKENYGFAGKKYIEALNSEGVLDALKAKQKRYYSELSGEIQDKQTLSASILLAADFLADKAIFHDGKALTVDEVKEYLITREQADVNARCYQWLLGFVAGNQRHFIPTESNTERWGVIENGVIYFNEVFCEREVRAAGFPYKSFLGWAERNNKILTESYGNGKNHRQVKRKTIDGRQTKCVAIVDDSDDQTDDIKPLKKPGENYVEVTGEELPF